MSSGIFRAVFALTAMFAISALAQAQSSTGKQTGLTNPSFEEPRGKEASFVLVETLPGWKTTDTHFEIWGTGFKDVAAHEGTQFVELNAYIDGILYQDSTGIQPGSVLEFTFAHRGRNGDDTMKLTITDLGADNALDGGDDTVLFTKAYTTGKDAWAVYNSTKEKPIKALGNTVRFAYRAISTATGELGEGNFLDAANFGIGVVSLQQAARGATLTFEWSGRVGNNSSAALGETVVGDNGWRLNGTPLAADTVITFRYTIPDTAKDTDESPSGGRYTEGTLNVSIPSMGVSSTPNKDYHLMFGTDGSSDYVMAQPFDDTGFALVANWPATADPWPNPNVLSTIANPKAGVIFGTSPDSKFTLTLKSGDVLTTAFTELLANPVFSSSSPASTTEYHIGWVSLDMVMACSNEDFNAAKPNNVPVYFATTVEMATRTTLPGLRVLEDGPSGNLNPTVRATYRYSHRKLTFKEIDIGGKYTAFQVTNYLDSPKQNYWLEVSDDNSLVINARDKSLVPAADNLGRWAFKKGQHELNGCLTLESMFVVTAAEASKAQIANPGNHYFLMLQTPSLVVKTPSDFRVRSVDVVKYWPEGNPTTWNKNSNTALKLIPAKMSKDSNVLDVPTYAQQTSMWCWATGGEMIMKYHGVSVAQCKQANDYYSKSRKELFTDLKIDCCGFLETGTKVDDRIVLGGLPQYQDYGFTVKQKSDSPLSFEEIKAQIDARQPIGFAWYWTSPPGIPGGGHYMVLTGYKTVAGIPMVKINDPWPNNVDKESNPTEHTRWMTYSYWCNSEKHRHGFDEYDFKKKP